MRNLRPFNQFPVPRVRFSVLSSNYKKRIWKLLKLTFHARKIVAKAVHGRKDGREKEWRSHYLQACLLLHRHGIETVDDREAGADDYVKNRRQWNSIIMALAAYMDYPWGTVLDGDKDTADN